MGQRNRVKNGYTVTTSSSQIIPPSQQRSRIMRAIRSRRNRTTELAFASALRAAGITGWRRHLPIPGRPDFAFKAARVAIFVDGCFWHGCRRHTAQPSTNAQYWIPKIAKTRKRDHRNTKVLQRQGWWVLRFWEHDIEGRSTKCIAKVAAILQSQREIKGTSSASRAQGTRQTVR
jgi:DNA mismatch endonuclease (patch repair protein)